MGSDGKNKKSCGRKLCCYFNTLGVLSVAVALAWYFVYFRKDVESLVGDCGGCFCIPDETTAFECPSKQQQLPEASYPEEPHLNTWKSLTILNPYVMDCNPYEDGVFCDTEPPLDPNFEWIKIGETAVCAIHYETSEPPQRGLFEFQAEGSQKSQLQQRGQRRRRAQREEKPDIAVDPREQEDSIEETLEDAIKDAIAVLDEELEIDQSENTTFADEENPEDVDEFAYENDTCENSQYYRIKTYPSREAAESAGGFVTHVGNCGVCSTLQDLAVYANVDFIGPTSPGNFCKRQAATSFETGLNCYLGLGLTQDCAKIWADTSWNTAKNCFGSCVVGSTGPLFGGDSKDARSGTGSNATDSVETDSNNWYDLPVNLRNRFTGSSNETESEEEEPLAAAAPGNGPAPECIPNNCITCNDEVSALTFERFAGRSRRRSGLLSTVAWPCGSIPKIVHDPCPVTLPLSE